MGFVLETIFFWYTSTLKSMAKNVAVWWEVFIDAVWSSELFLRVFDVFHCNWRTCAHLHKIQLCNVFFYSLGGEKYYK